MKTVLGRNFINYLNKKGFSLILFLTPFLSYGQFVSVCDRTPQIRDAIMEKIAVIDSEIECQDDDLLKLTLSEIAALELDGKFITFLKSGDFSGLSSLTHLYIYNNDLTSLPPGIFSGLSSLEMLYLDNNSLTSLPPDIFPAGLSRLEVVSMTNNPLNEQTMQDLESYGQQNGVDIRF